MIPRREKRKHKLLQENETTGSPAKKVLFDNRIKRKNVLALNEKVAAIKEYQKMPVYKHVGRLFQCSPDQIKRIVQQKDTILKAWEQRTRRCQDAKTLEMKVVRVSMLGKAVYDWIRRMLYYKDLMITDGLIQKMALQFKIAMGLQQFFPHQDWVDKFRQTYNIKIFDSKLLNIAYSQGFSVQIKDIVKDILSECTPDLSPENIEFAKKNDNKIYQSKIEDSIVKKEQLINSVTQTSVTSTNTTTSCPMPKLQPIHQLVTLPFTSNGINMTQKVLVATPITSTTARKVPNASAVTMTIIPLATIGKSANNNLPTTPIENNVKRLVPPPLIEIKKEIKEESDEVISIKQECISDEEYGNDDMNDEMDERKVSIGYSNDMDMQTAETMTSEPTVQSEVKSKKIDSDDLSLSHLRDLIQREAAASVKVVASLSGSVKVTNFNSPPKYTYRPTTTASSSSAQIIFSAVQNPQHCNSPPPLHRVGSPIPYLPRLTSPPQLHRIVNNRIKRKADMPALPPISSFAEARKYVKMLEDFALLKENYRLIGLVTRADEVLRELDHFEE